MKFRKKPVVIDALRFTASLSPADLHHFLGSFDNLVVGKDHIVIRTLEGDMRADEGDWIIKGVKGEFYPCKPDIFAATYEPA
jgi:hypothetical protein